MIPNIYIAEDTPHRAVENLNDEPQSDFSEPNVGSGKRNQAAPSEDFENRLSQEAVQSVFDLHASGLRSFLLGVLKDESATSDAIQATFVQLMEKGHTIHSSDLASSAAKSWLFRVAFNQAMLVKRKRKVVVRHQENVARLFDSRRQQSRSLDAEEVAIQSEEIERVKKALEQLPDEQRMIVVTRIHEGLKFREIAEKLELPLGTVLSRMQSGLKRLKLILDEP